MNTHKNANKQGEKILLGGVAAAALGLINAKPQTVKAANQNGTRATKKTTTRAVKTKLNYQTESTETNSETKDETATDDNPTGQTSDSQSIGSEANTSAASNNPETGQEQDSANNNPASRSNQNATTDKAKANKQEAGSSQFDPANVIRDNNATISSTWEDIPVTFHNNVLSLGEKDKTYTIDNSANNNISISQNISNVTPDDITEIDINAPIAIKGSANGVFNNLKNITSINGLDKLDTSQVTNMQQMFASCPKLTELDLSSFNTNKVTNYTGLFLNDTNLTSINLYNFTIADDAKMLIMFRFCSNLKKLVLGSGFKIPEIKGKPGSFLPDLGTWVNMGVDQGSPAKGTNKWSSTDLMTKYQGSTDHDTYVCFANLGGTVTVHRQDEDGKQLVDQDGKEIPDEKLFGNISDSVTVDTSKEFAGYKFKENKNSDITAFTSDPQDITLVYSKTKTDNTTISSTWENIPVTFNNGVLSIGEKGKTYTINNSDNKDISISQNVSGVTADDITEIDINAPIAIIGSAEMLFSRLTNLNTINGLDKLDTSKVTSMLWMFFDCKKMTSLDLSSFDTTNVTSFNVMFAADPSLTSVDLSSFTVANDATTMGMFVLTNNYTSSLTKLILGKGFKFTTRNGRPNNSLQQPGTWVNMGEGNGSLAKGTNQWSSADFMTKYQGDRDHDTYVRYTGGTVTVHRQDEDGNQLIDQDGKQIPDEKLFGNISDSVTVDTSKEFAGYKFKENKNSDIKAFISDPQDITLVYSKSKTDNTWEGVPYTFNNGVLSLGEKGKTYTIDNTAGNEIGINNNISTINTDNITEIDILGKITINGPADSLFDTLPNLTQINGLNNLITSNITDMSYMFANCPKLVSSDLSSFDTSKVTFFSSMFYADTDLSSVNLSSFTITDDAILDGLFDSCTNLTKLTLGKGVKFPLDGEQPEDLLKQPGIWVNMGEGDGSLAKGTNQWSSADLMTNYQGDRDHDTYVRYTGGIVTVHRQDEDGKQLVDQDGKEIPDEKLFGNVSDPITVDTSKEFAGYKFKENKNSDIKAFISDPQDITLVYSKNKADNTSDGSDGSNSSNSSDSSNGSSSSDSSNSSNSSNSSDSSNGSNNSDSSNGSNSSDSSNGSNSSDSSNGSNSSDSSNGSNSSDSSNGSNSSDSSNGSNSSDSSNGSNSSDSSNGSNSSNSSNSSNGSNASNTAGSIVSSPAAIAPAVTVHYQDEYGNTVAPDRIIQGRIGDGYTTGAETVSGYTLKTRPDNATGFFISSPQSVTYVYSKNDGQTNNSTTAPAGNQTPTDNEPTPIPASKKNKKKKAPKKAIKGLHANKQSKKAPAKSIKGLTANKHQANRPAKLAAADRKLNKKGKLNQESSTDALPQTGVEKHNSLAMLALGGLALATALGAAWLERKKN